MNDPKMVRKQIYLEPGQDFRVKLLSSRRGKSEAEVIREAIAQYLGTELPSVEDPLEQLVGIVKSGGLEASIKHDEQIYLDDENR
jgi:hypothetical protein